MPTDNCKSGQYLCISYYVPGIVLSVLYTHSLDNHSSPIGEYYYYYYPPFAVGVLKHRETQ